MKRFGLWFVGFVVVYAVMRTLLDHQPALVLLLSGVAIGAIILLAPNDRDVDLLP